MSISELRADTMMIGTRLVARRRRHTSTPDRTGSITSSSTTSGRQASKRSRAWPPSDATSTPKPSAPGRRRGRRRRRARRPRPGRAAVASPRPVGGRRVARSPGTCCHRRHRPTLTGAAPATEVTPGPAPPATGVRRGGSTSGASQRQPQRERRALALPGVRRPRRRRGWWPRGARRPGRARCRRSRRLRARSTR